MTAENGRPVALGAAGHTTTRALSVTEVLDTLKREHGNEPIPDYVRPDGGVGTGDWHAGTPLEGHGCRTDTRLCTGRTCRHWPSLPCRVMAEADSRGMTGIHHLHVEHEPGCAEYRRMVRDGVRANLTPAERARYEARMTAHRQARRTARASRRRNRR